MAARAAFECLFASFHKNDTGVKSRLCCCAERIAGRAGSDVLTGPFWTSHRRLASWVFALAEFKPS